MKRKMIKGAVASALVLAMAASCVGCTKKDGTKSSADPSLAKEGVYSYKEIDIGMGEDSYYNIAGLGAVGDKSEIVVQTYEDDSNIYMVYCIGSSGQAEGSYALTMPDTSEFEMQTYSDDYDYGVIYEDAVGEVENTMQDVVVLTTGVTVTTEGTYEDSYVDDEYYYDDDYYYDDYYEEGLYSNISIQNLSIGNDGSIVGIAEYYCSGYQDGNYVYCDEYIICGWNASGALQWQNSISDLVESEYIYTEGATLLNNGNYFAVIGGDKVVAYTFDKLGNCINKKDASQVKELESVVNLTCLKDGSLLLVYYDMDDDYKTKSVILDADTITVKQSVDLPDSIKSNANGYYPGVDTDLVSSTNTGLVKYNIGGSDATLFMNFVNSDLDSSYMVSVCMIDNEHFIGTYYDGGYGMKVSYFTYVDPKDIPDKEVINLAVYYIGYEIRSRIIDFNKTSDKYRIIVTNYYEYATEDDYTAGYKQMNNDIISGKCPDIVIASDSYLNFATYANKGMLKDFDELFEKDEELKDKEYLSNVFDAFAINGKHYIGIYSFNFQSFMGSSKIFGNAKSWTISDFKNMQSSFPAGSQLYPYATRENFLNYIMSFDGNEFVDVESGKCDFDSEDFITLLEYAAALPEEYVGDEDMWMDYDSQFRSGKTILNNTYVYDANWYQQSRYEYFDGESALVGFPSRTGDSSIITTDGYPIAIFSQGNVAGAWEFVRGFFTEDYQSSLEYSIPVLESAFNDWAEKGMERPHYEYEGEIEYYDNYYYVDGVDYVVPVMTQEEVDELKNAIKSCSKSAYYNQEIYEIIEEEASACFARQKTAKEVATIIQSRVQLYINENY